MVDVTEFDIESAAPVSVDFDFDSAVALPIEGEKIYLENQQSTVELPSGGIARIQAIVGGAYDKGNAGRALNELYSRQMFGDDSPQTAQAITRLREKSSQEFGLESWSIEDIARAGAEQTPQLLGLAESAARRGMQGSMFGGGIALAGGQMGPQIATPEEIVTVPAAALTGGVIGARYGVAEYSFMQNAGEAYGEFSEFLDKEGVKIENKNLARMGAMMVGAANAGFDTISLGQLSKVFVGKNLIMDKLKASGAKSVVVPKTKEAIMRWVLDLSKAVAVEAGTEGLQEGVKGLGGNVVKNLSTQEFENLAADEIFANMGEAASEAAKATVAIGGAGGVVRGSAGIVKGKDESADITDPQLAAQAINESDTTTPEVKEAIKTLEEINPDYTMENLQQVVETPESMQDPVIAAKVMMQTATPDVKAAIEALPKGFTMEQLQAVVAERANKAIEPIIGQMTAAQKNQIENIQAETDDISTNLLREVTALQENKSIVDKDIQDMLENTRALLQERRKTPKPLSLVGFVKKIGGVKEFSGELKNMGMKDRQAARNDKTGLELDMAREAAAEAGYIDNNSTVADFLVALENDFKRPDSVISERDIGNQVALGDIDNMLSHLDKELGEKGITYNRKALTELRKRVSANKKLDRKITKEVKQKEAMLQRLESDKRKAEQTPPRILADKLKTFISGMRKGGVLQKRETADVQNKLIEIIEQSGLEANDRAKFIRTIKNTQTIEQLEAALPDVMNRLERLSEAKQRRDILAKIRSVLSKTKTTKQAGKPVGKFGAETQDILDPVREAIKMKAGKAAIALEKNLLVDKLPTPEQALINKALAIAAGNEDVSTKDMGAFLDEINNIVSEGRTGRKNSIFARMVRIGSMKIEARDIITKGENLELIDETAFKRRLEKLWNNSKAIADGWLFGWYDIPDILFGKSDLRDNLRVGEQVQQEKGIVRRMTERLEEVGMQAFGFTKRKQLLNQISEDSKIIDLGVMPDAKGTPRRLQMSKTQMRKLWMEWQDHTLHETLFSEQGNGYTEQMVQTIMQYLTPQDRAFAQAQMGIYRQFRNDVNDVYSRTYGVNLPKNENYSPIRREVDVDMDAGEFLTDINYRRSVSSGALKSRVNNLRKLRLQSDVEVYQRHIMEMAHFISFSEKIQEIQGVFGNSSIRKAIEKKHGSAMVSIIDDYIRLITLGGPERADVIGKVINTLNRNFAVSVLGGKAALLPKQLTSFVASAADMPTGEWTAGIADFAKNHKKAIKILAESELMKSRGASPEKDIASVGKAVDWEIFKKKQRFDEILLLPTKLGDRGAIYVGGWPVYRHAINQGKTHEQAISAFETWVAVTQQSADVDQLSKIQASSPFVRAFTMFLSAPMSYLRAEVRAIRHYSRGEITRAQLTKKIAIYHFVIPSLFQFVANGFDWDEDDQIVAMVTGPLNGFVIFGDAIARAVGGAMGKHYFAGEPNFASFAADITKGIADAVSGTMEGDMDEILEGLTDIMRGAGTAAGLPVDQAKNVFEGIEAIEDGDTGKGVKRIAGWPKGAIEDND